MSCYLIRYGSGKCVRLQQVCCFFIMVCFANICWLSWGQVAAEKITTVDLSSFCAAFKLGFVWSLI
jgi:hypothetical protein